METENRGRLGWNARVGIIKEVAKGMEFLHAHGSLRVPHGNLKSSNVMVIIQRDDTIQVKLTEYGLLGVIMGDKLSVGTTPEFGDGKKVTRKADVYCFGILVLEIMTGKAPSPSQRDLSGWVRAAVTNDWSTDVLDVEILGEKDGYDDMLKLTEIALECTDDMPERRPTMTQVLTMLQDITHH